MNTSHLFRWLNLLAATSLFAACGGGDQATSFVQISKATASPLRVAAPAISQPKTFVVRWSVKSDSNCLNSNLMASQPGNGYSFGSQVQCDSKDFEQTCTVSADAGDSNVRLVSCNRADDGFRASPGTVLLEVESFYTSDTYPNPVFSDNVFLTVTLE